MAAAAAALDSSSSSSTTGSTAATTTILLVRVAVVSAAVAAVAVAALSPLSSWSIRTKPKSTGSSESAADSSSSSSSQKNNDDDLVELSVFQSFFQQSQNIGIDHIVASVVFRKSNTTTTASHNKERPIPTKAELEEVVQALQTKHVSLRAVLTYQPPPSSDSSSKKPPKLVLCLPNHPYVRDHPNLPKDGTAMEWSGQVTIYNDNTTTTPHKTWKQVAHEQLNAIVFPNPSPQQVFVPLWKVALVLPPPLNDDTHDHDGDDDDDDTTAAALIFTLSHVLWDGTSRNLLLREFWRCLWSNDYRQSLLHPSPQQQPQEPQEPLMNVKALSAHTPAMPWHRFAWEQLWKGILLDEWNKRGGGWSWWFPGQSQRQRRPRRWVFGLSLATAPIICHDDPTTTLVRETRFLTHSLTCEETKALLQMCQSQQTTVHGALSAAAFVALVALARREQEQQRQQSKNANQALTNQQQQEDVCYFFTIVHLVSLWKYIKPLLPTNPTNVVTGNFFTTYGYNVPIAPEWLEPNNNYDNDKDDNNDDIRNRILSFSSFWTLAREIRHDLQTTFAPLSFPQLLTRMAVRQLCRQCLDLCGFSSPLPWAYTTHFPSIVAPNFFISNNGRVDWNYNNDNNNNNSVKTVAAAETTTPQTTTKPTNTSTTMTTTINTPTTTSTTTTTEELPPIQALFAMTARHHQPFGMGGFNVQTVLGQMHVSWTYYSHVWSDETAHLFFTQFQTTLLDMSRHT